MRVTCDVGRLLCTECTELAEALAFQPIPECQEGRILKRSEDTAFQVGTSKCKGPEVSGFLRETERYDKERV